MGLASDVPGVGTGVQAITNQQGPLSDLAREVRQARASLDVPASVPCMSLFVPPIADE